MQQKTLNSIITDILKTHHALSIGQYMHLCLSHSGQGYYIKGNPIGKKGDFITSPEISQIFGELIGIWLIAHWTQMGCPAPFAICELGAGRGTLMQDALRAARLQPEFAALCEIYFIEQNKPLKAQQRKRIPIAKWVNSIEDLPQIPTFFITNEFFDALPIEQYRLENNTLQQLFINQNRQLFWKTAQLTTEQQIYINEKKIQNGDFFEVNWQAQHIFKQISVHLSLNKGAGLFFDYGYNISPNRCTLRGFKNHQLISDITLFEGEMDLTADVDFSALSHIAQNTSCIAYPLLTQKDFLKSMNAPQRLQTLLKTANSKQAALLISGLDKLMNDMGERFKCLAITDSFSPNPYPFFVHK
jgi:NADH dehydrogenase [ubiquinone] 1 alpha subcomplex assembly factor 7